MDIFSQSRVEPLISYYGGKQGLIDFLLPLFPPHKTFCDVFGGSGAVSLATPPAAIEVYNDIDPGVVNLHRVVQDPATMEPLRQALLLTPNSRREHAVCKRAYPASDPVEWARQYVVLVRQSYSSLFAKSWGYSRTSPGNHFYAAAERMRAVSLRLRNVRIENRHFRELFPLYDAPDTLWYLDPPYLPETRTELGCYKCEMARVDHEELLHLIRQLQGMVVLSGYASKLYDNTLANWGRAATVVACPSSPTYRIGSLTKPTRTEVVWLNPRCVAAQRNSINRNTPIIAAPTVEPAVEMIVQPTPEMAALS